MQPSANCTFLGILAGSRVPKRYESAIAQKLDNEAPVLVNDPRDDVTQCSEHQAQVFKLEPILKLIGETRRLNEITKQKGAVAEFDRGLDALGNTQESAAGITKTGGSPILSTAGSANWIQGDPV